MFYGITVNADITVNQNYELANFDISPRLVILS